MIIKQKKHQNRELVEYTEKELDVLLTMMIIFWVIGIIASAVNTLISACILSEKCEDKTLMILIVIVIGVTIAVVVMRPITRIILRHLSIPAPTQSGAVSNTLIKWYTESRYFVAMAVLFAATVLNIVSCARLAWLADRYGKIGAYGAFGVGLLSVATMILWVCAAVISEKADYADLEVVHDEF